MPPTIPDYQEHTSKTTTETGATISGAAARENAIRQNQGLKPMQQKAYLQGHKDGYEEGFEEGRKFGQTEAYQAVSAQMTRIEEMLKKSLPVS